MRLRTARKMWVSAIKLIAVCDLWPLPLLTSIPSPLAAASATGQTLNRWDGLGEEGRVCFAPRLRCRSSRLLPPIIYCIICTVVLLAKY